VAGEDHAPGLADGLGEDRVRRVVARQALQLAAQSRLHARRLVRRQPIDDLALGAGLRLVEQHVEGDDGGAGFAQPPDEIGLRGARPRPAPDDLEAGFVDRDDGDRSRDLPGPPDLEVLIVEVELQAMQEIRVDPEQAADEHHHTERDEQAVQPRAAADLRHQSAALKYFAAGWWKTSAVTEMPISSGRSRSHSVAWSARSGQAG